MKALLIPVEGPVEELELDGNLDELQRIVGGNIQSLPMPEFVKDRSRATAYVNEEGKFLPDCKPNMRATDFMVPGMGLFFGDYIAGPFLLLGFDPQTGDHADVPQGVVDRVRLIEDEAS